jgi:hypothetical protein
MIGLGMVMWLTSSHWESGYEGIDAPLSDRCEDVRMCNVESLLLFATLKEKNFWEWNNPQGRAKPADSNMTWVPVLSCVCAWSQILSTFQMHQPKNSLWKINNKNGHISCNIACSTFHLEVGSFRTPWIWVLLLWFALASRMWQKWWWPGSESESQGALHA